MRFAPLLLFVLAAVPVRAEDDRELVEALDECGQMHMTSQKVLEARARFRKRGAAAVPFLLTRLNYGEMVQQPALSLLNDIAEDGADVSGALKTLEHIVQYQSEGSGILAWPLIMRCGAKGKAFFDATVKQLDSNDPYDRVLAGAALRKYGGTEGARGVAVCRKVTEANSLVAAAKSGRLDDARRLLNAGVDPDWTHVGAYPIALPCGPLKYRTPLLAAIEEGHEDMVKLLLLYHADPEKAARGGTPLEVAARLERAAIVRLLQKAGAEGDAEQMLLTAKLVRAACRRPVQAPDVTAGTEEEISIEEVLKLGAEINRPDEDGVTPLMHAADLGLADNVRTLLRHGARLDIETPRGNTALSLARREKRTEVEQILVQAMDAPKDR